MIFNFIINFVLVVISSIFYLFPVVTISSIPIFGPLMATTLNFAVNLFNGFQDVFPYATFVWQIFLFVILPFEALMLLAKLVLGSRVPTND